MRFVSLGLNVTFRPINQGLFTASLKQMVKKSIHISLKTVVFLETFLQFLYYTMKLVILKFYSSAGNGVWVKCTITKSERENNGKT